MKRLLYFLLAALTLQACNVEADKPEVIDQTFDPTDEELYAACADLQGIGQFVIGKTTFKQVLNDKDYKKATSEFDRRTNLYNGHWGNDYWKGPDDNISNSYEKAKWIEKESKNQLKQLYISIGGINVGDLKFEKFDMAFLNDTLVAIWYYPDGDIEDEVIEHYKEKYGDGRGHYKYTHSRIKVGDDLTATETTDEARTWANENVAIDYVKDHYFHTEPGSKPVGYYKDELLMYSRKRYPVFDQTLKGLAKQYDDNRNKDKKGAIDAL